jgi:hypothetical protein
VYVRFADGITRTLLAAPQFWLSLPNLDAIPVAKQKAAPVPESDDDEAEVVDEEEVEPELVPHKREIPDHDITR